MPIFSIFVLYFSKEILRKISQKIRMLKKSIKSYELLKRYL